MMEERNLSELPIEKEYSENINRKMQVPQSIKLMSSNGSMGTDSSYYETNDHHMNYDYMKAPHKITAFTDRSDFDNDDNYNSAKGKQHVCDWPVIPSYQGDSISMSPPPRRISANTPTNMPSLSSKYPQIRKADPQRKLFDTNEESLLNDLDDTTENEKLRKQIFKLNRRLTTLEKQSKEEKEAAKIMVVVLTCGIVASLLIGLTQH